MPTERRIARMREVLKRRQRDLQIVVDNVHDPHNAAAILRTCDAFGLAAVNFVYTDQTPPEISEAVSGYARKWLDLRSFSDHAKCVESLHEQGIRLYATLLDEKARDFREVDWTQPSAVAFGNEHRGCTPELVELADGIVQVPMLGMAQSLNVSVSAAVIMSEAARQRSEAGLYEPSWDEWHEETLRRWIARDEPWTGQ